MPIIEITIPGVPIAKKRARSKGFGRPYNCQRREEDQFKLLANSQIKQAAPKDEPVQLWCVFYFPVPKSKSKKDCRQIFDNHGAHVYKPDGDNLVKMVKDCLNGIAWHDDSQVWHADYRKLYGAVPRTDITIEWNERIRIETIPGVKIKPQKYMGEG